MQFNTAIVNVPTAVGAIYWDDNNKTFTGIMEPANGDTVNLQFGQENYMRGVNKTGTTISNGEVVFVSGAQGNRPKMDLPASGNYANAVRTIGMATEEVPNNLYGYFTKEGTVRGLDTSMYTVSECIYVGTVSGTFTTVTPAFGDARIKVGIVMVSHPTQGEIEVCIHEDKYMFGDPDSGDFTGFEGDGFLLARGGAIAYRDEYVGGQYFVPSGANAPDEVNITIGGVVTKKYAFDGVNTVEKLGNTFEIAHDVAVGEVNAGTETIEVHVHSGASDTNTGTATYVVNWALLKAQGSVITGSNVTMSVYYDGVQYGNYIIGGDLVVPTEGFGIGDLIEFTVTRNYALASDTYEHDSIFYKCALHVPLNTMGSREKYVK